MVARLWIPPAQPMTVAPSTRSSRPYPYKLNDTRCRKKAQRNDCARSNVLDGKVIGRCMQRHRHEEFVRFLNAVGA